LNHDIALLRHLGMSLDVKVAAKQLRRGGIRENATVRDLLIQSLLRVRSKARGQVRLRPNRAQREFSRTCTHRNIVLKARQMGITTYVAARFFIQTITRPGTMTVQVAHDQESAEEIFRIVHRFWENLPEGMKRGALLRSRANVRQMVFPRLDSEYRVATAAEARMEMLFGSGQPGRMSVAEDRIEKLERNDVRCGVYDRLVNAVLTTAISVLIALHDRWWK
jgi:hypothetical protein